ncbi:MAG: porin family protein [Prevotellamassilia sp.]|nr:porin family protein [Prevotellamassilia sp.]
MSLNHSPQSSVLRVCSLLAFCLTMAATVQAQVGERRDNIALGASGGVALNTIAFDPTIKQTMHVGYTAGVVARFTSEKYFKALCSLQLELNYTQLGWKENVLNAQSQPLPDTYRRDLHYLQLPMLARLAWGREKRGVMGYVLAGPQIGWCLGEQTEQSAFTMNEEGVPDRPNGLYAQYGMSIEKKFDYGITGGLGMEINTRIGHFCIEGRYYYGLSDIYKNSKKDVFSRSNHGTIIAKISYLIDIR